MITTSMQKISFCRNVTTAKNSRRSLHSTPGIEQLHRSRYGSVRQCNFGDSLSARTAPSNQTPSTFLRPGATSFSVRPAAENTRKKQLTTTLHYAVYLKHWFLELYIGLE